MLRMIPSTNAVQARSYYSTADYYTQGQELTGCWRGKAAAMLGLSGDVKQADWDALCENLHPATGEQLTKRKNTERIVGYDCNFHVPKSVSLLFAVTKNERLLDALRESVQATMQDMEAEMKTRVRKGGKQEDRETGNLVWGEFVHTTSRPVDSVPDPHLHIHAYAFNATYDREEQAWKAGKFRDLKRDAPYFEAVFHSRLAHKLSDLGLPIERTKNGWELAGIDKAFIAKFSRRTTQIEEKARKLGIENAQAKDGLGARTRENKQKNLAWEQLQSLWNDRMTPAERQTLAELAERIGGESAPKDETAAGRGLEYAVGHSFERKSVVPERRLLATALRQSVGQATPDDVMRHYERSSLINGTRYGQRMVTTREVLDEERRLVKFARDGRGTCRPFVERKETFERDWLNTSQKQAVRHVVESRDRIILVRGAAGVGKTTLMQEAVETIEQSGTKVLAFAPSADASRGTLRDAGFKDADTVARLLVDDKLQQQAAGQLLWIDEAGLLGTKTMADVFALAEQINARVLLTGDRYQHGAVERGAALKLLEEEAGVVPASVKEIQRQQGTYKAAVRALSEGDIATGFKRLDGLGWIQEIPQGERYEKLAADYVATIAAGKSALVVSPTHSEGDKITAEIRSKLKDASKLGKVEREFRVLSSANLTEAERGDAVNYATGDVLVFHQNAKGFARGQRVMVDSEQALPLDQAKNFQVYRAATLPLAAGDTLRITQNGRTLDGEHRLNNGALYQVKGFDKGSNIVLENGWVVGKDFGHWQHGYCVTSHSSQGKTVDRVFVGQSSESFSASSAEQFYVSASRARECVTIYCDDKAALMEAVRKSDERISATEFINSVQYRVALARAAEYREQTRELAERSKERGRGHER